MRHSIMISRPWRIVKILRRFEIGLGVARSRFHAGSQVLTRLVNEIHLVGVNGVFVALVFAVLCHLPIAQRALHKQGRSLAKIMGAALGERTPNKNEMPLGLLLPYVI